MKYSYFLIFIIYFVTNSVMAQPDQSQEWPFESDAPSVEDDDVKKERSKRDLNRPNPGQLVTVNAMEEMPSDKEEKPETEDFIPIEPVAPVYPTNPVPVYNNDTPSQTVYSNPFIMDEELRIPTEPIKLPDEDTINDILQSSEIAETAMSYETLKNSKEYMLSLSGYLSPFYQETKSRTWMFLNVSGEFGWLLNDQLELGPFVQLDLSIFLDGVGTTFDNDSQIVAGGFAEYHFYKLNSMGRFFPSLGAKVGYSGLGGFNRSGLLSQLYLDMVFFLSQGIGIKWSIGPALVLTLGRPDYTIQVDSRFGLVYYF